MNFFTISTPQQTITIDQLRNSGCDLIQVSNGLIVKTDKSLSEIQGCLENADVRKLDVNDPGLSKDARVFAGLEA